jgi:hypothetical protein
MKVKIMIRKTFQGAYELSAIIGEDYIRKQYLGYTKREAIKLFKQYLATC